MKQPRQLAAWAASLAFASIAQSASAAPDVLQVGTWQGKQGAYTTVQSAVNAARPGDWILIAPGSYHETGPGVQITTPGIHVRGMDRNAVVIDGTRVGAATCDPDPSAQVLGPDGSGRNGIEVVKVDGVTIENLSVCNFLNGSGCPSVAYSTFPSFCRLAAARSAAAASN